MTDRLGAFRVPPHVTVMLGVSTAAYAVTLAGVTGMQATSEAGLAAQRAPAIARVQDLATRNDALAADLALAGQRFDAVAAAYVAAGGRVSDLESALASLATSTHAIDGVSRSLPTGAALPRVTRVAVGGTAPATSATTGASGAP